MHTLPNMHTFHCSHKPFFTSSLIEVLLQPHRHGFFSQSQHLDQAQTNGWMAWHNTRKVLFCAPNELQGNHTLPRASGRHWYHSLFSLLWLVESLCTSLIDVGLHLPWCAVTVKHTIIPVLHWGFLSWPCVCFVFISSSLPSSFFLSSLIHCCPWFRNSFNSCSRIDLLLDVLNRMSG